MPAPSNKRSAPIAFLLAAILLLADDVLLYFFVENFFGLRPALELRFVVAAIFLVLNAGLLWLIFKTRQQKAVTGGEAMAGKTGVVVRVNGSGLWVQVHGELWRGRCEANLGVGARVVIQSLDGLVLEVKPLE